MCALFLIVKGGESMAKKQKTIKSELLKIVRKKLSPEYLEKAGIAELARKQPSVIEALALAQVKKGLEGDLKAAVFIEELLDDTEADGAQPYDVVVKVVGEENGN